MESTSPFRLGCLMPWLGLALLAPVADAQPCPRLSDTPAHSPRATTLAHWMRADVTFGPVVSAHRGGPAPGYPENALETFERTMSRTSVPLILETDARLTADSALVLLHDDTLERTTTGSGRVDAYRLDDLRALRLRDPDSVATPFRIPTLREALDWAYGRAVLTVEPKRGVPPGLLVRVVRAAQAETRVIVILHDTAEYAAYLQAAPELAYSVNVPTEALLDEVMAVPGANLCNVVAFVGTKTPPRPLLDRLAAANVRTIQGVFGQAEHVAHAEGARSLQRVRQQGVDIIATGAVDAASKASMLEAVPGEEASCDTPDGPKRKCAPAAVERASPDVPGPR